MIVSSVLLNMFALAPAIFMYAVYEYVISSYSQFTLFVLTMIALISIFLQLMLERVRGDKLNELAEQIKNQIIAQNINKIFFRPNRVADVKKIPLLMEGERYVLPIINGTATYAIDLMFVPIYWVALFYFHPYLMLYAMILALFGYLIVAYAEKQKKSALQGDMSISDVSRLVKEEPKFYASGVSDQIINKIKMLLNERNKQLFEAQAEQRKWGGVIKDIMSFGSTTSVALAALLVINNMVTPVAIFMTMMLFMRALQPMMGFIQSFGASHDFFEARENIKKIDHYLEESGSKNLVPPDIPSFCIHNLSIRVGEPPKYLLANTTYQFKAGSSYAIIGPSGIGKSSLLCSLAGIREPYMGLITINTGLDISSLSQSERKKIIAYSDGVMMSSCLELWEYLGVSAADEDGQVSKALFKFNLHDQIASLPSGLNTAISNLTDIFSSGEQQRLELMRVYLSGAKIWLIDEPTSRLDPVNVNIFLGLISEHKARSGIAILVTHDLGLASKLDQALLLANKRLEAVRKTNE